jgi:hypothetical protein
MFSSWHLHTCGKVIAPMSTLLNVFNSLVLRPFSSCVCRAVHFIDLCAGVPVHTGADGGPEPDESPSQHDKSAAAAFKYVPARGPHLYGDILEAVVCHAKLAIRLWLETWSSMHRQASVLCLGRRGVVGMRVSARHAHYPIFT